MVAIQHTAKMMHLLIATGEPDDRHLVNVRAGCSRIDSPPQLGEHAFIPAGQARVEMRARASVFLKQPLLCPQCIGAANELAAIA
jgi:hypothetical protein